MLALGWRFALGGVAVHPALPDEMQAMKIVWSAARAILPPAKSKRLTLEARRGDDGVLKDDFKKSILDSYAQGRTCARLLLDRVGTALDQFGNAIVVPKIKQICLLCAVCDHYPALSFQARQFLQASPCDGISAPSS
ncbi:MAG TPA: hypothetical protein VH250_06415 [Granulicella sp.]|nr:hypothetical protein [Granulicella sp.]